MDISFSYSQWWKNDITEPEFDLDSQAIHTHMELDKGSFFFTNRHGRNSLFMVPLRKYPESYTVLTIFTLGTFVEAI